MKVVPKMIGWGMGVTVCLVVVLAGNAAEQSVVAFENGTIQPGGPRQGSLGEAFFNIEGSDNGDFASYGLARFDVSGIKDQFNSDFGADNWTLQSAELLLTQANAGFTRDGLVDAFFTADDDTEQFLLSYPFNGDFPDAELIVSYEFVEVATGEIETHLLYDRSAANTDGGLALKDHIQSSDVVTLALVDAEPTVAATYAGFSNNTSAGPTLRLTADAGVPVALQAGDADQDLDFDQFDLIQVQVANKYLSDQPATWGEGDWNAAPGGTPGSPPVGDGRFNQLDIIAAQVAGLYLTGPYGAIAPGGPSRDARITVAAETMAVPEPASGLLLAWAMMGAWLYGRQKR